MQIQLSKTQLHEAAKEFIRQASIRQMVWLLVEHGDWHHLNWMTFLSDAVTAFSKRFFVPRKDVLKDLRTRAAPDA